MTIHDLYLLSPELSTIGIAILLSMLDLVVKRKDWLVVVGLLGLIIPATLAVSLWVGLNGGSVSADDSVQIRSITTFTVDKFSLFFKLLFIGTLAVVILVSNDYVRKFPKFKIEYYSLLFFSVTGMMLLSSSVEMVTIFISLELTALPVAALAAFLSNSRSAESAMKFLVMGAISSAIFLYGMVLIYGFTGSTSLSEIAARLGNIGLSGNEPFGAYAILMGIILIIAGLGFKITAAPFHMWAPDVYQGAPTPITSFLSVASKAAGFAIILRVFYTTFMMPVINVEWSIIFAVLAVLSMTIGNLVAIVQSNIKRMLAYSTIAHAGYLLIGLAAVTSRVAEGNETIMGPSSVLFYLVGYCVMNLAAFASVIAISIHTRSDDISDFSGMGLRAPYAAAVLTFSMISLTGIPPTIGFMAKLYVFGAAVNAGLSWLVVVGVINSVISLYYYFRVVKVLYLSDDTSEERMPSGLLMNMALTSTAVGVLFLGIYPKPLFEFARTAAEALINMP